MEKRRKGKDGKEVLETHEIARMIRRTDEADAMRSESRVD